MPGVLSAEESAAIPLAAHAALARYLAGEVSPEIALMHLLLIESEPQRLTKGLEALAAAAPERREFAELLRLARALTESLAEAALLVRAGLAEDVGASGGIAAIRRQFDSAVATAPEAAVALYSFGDAAILDRATAEIVTRLHEWGLVGPDRTLLDIGCGIGRFERALAASVASITAIDLSPGMIEEARRRCGELTNVGFLCCNGQNLDGFADRSFDLVLAVDSFPYMIAVDPDIAARHVAEAARVLRRGGSLAILNFSYRGDLGQDRAEIGRLAAAYGFTVERAGTRDLALWDGATFLLRR